MRFRAGQCDAVPRFYAGPGPNGPPALAGGCSRSMKSCGPSCSGSGGVALHAVFDGILGCAGVGSRAVPGALDFVGARRAAVRAVAKQSGGRCLLRANRPVIFASLRYLARAFVLSCQSQTRAFSF